LIRFIVAHWSKMSNTLKLIYQADRVDDESRFSFFKQVNPIETKLRQGLYTAAL